MTSTAEWKPIARSEGYARWSLPAQGWSGAEFHEDSISIFFENGEWTGFTEVDQCVKRDLDDEEVASVRAEFNLTA